MLTTPPTLTPPAAAPAGPGARGAGTRSAARPARTALAFPTQLVLWALRALAGDRACHATALERVAWTCRTAGAPGAFPALVGLAGCLGRGPRARCFDAPAAAGHLDPAELAALLLVRDASAGRRAACARTAAALVTRPDVVSTIGYATTVGAELAAAGLPVELRAPVLTLPCGPGRRDGY